MLRTCDMIYMFGWGGACRTEASRYVGEAWPKRPYALMDMYIIRATVRLYVSIVRNTKCRCSYNFLFFLQLHYRAIAFGVHYLKKYIFRVYLCAEEGCV